MKKRTSFGLPALLLAAALTLASCGGSGESTQGSAGSGGDTQETGETTGSMAGMDHGSMEMGSGETAQQMVAPDGEYSDAAFVDAMVPHHEGAVEMAEVALENAEHEEIRTLAQDIIDAQRAEIELFGEVREELGDATTEMSQEEMEGMMGMSEDPRQLASEDPFDKAFIDAMIPHHESAIEMANVSLEESEDPEILRIAEDIVNAQEREIAQMRQWREGWYPEG